MSYRVYQHLGNLSPRALDEDDLYGRVRGNVHATAELREFATRARHDRGPAPAGASAATSAAPG